MHHDADEVAHVGAAAGDVEAGDAQEAAAGAGEAREGAEERRLAGAVGPEKGEDAAPAELEVEASKDGAGAKPLGQARGADGRVGGGHARLPCLEACVNGQGRQQATMRGAHGMAGCHILFSQAGGCVQIRP